MALPAGLYGPNDGPSSPRATRQPVTPNRTNLPPDVRVLRRLLADRTGQRARDNSAGIRLEINASGNQIGGTRDNERNIISGNVDAVIIDGTGGPRVPGEVAVEYADSVSAMTPRFNLFFRWFARRFFRHFDLDDATVERLRELERSGTVIYVMRYASRLDYFLFNELFRREGLRLSSFANGLRFYYYRPLF